LGLPKVQGTILLFWWMFFAYLGFGKPNFGNWYVIGGVDFLLDRVEVKKLLDAIFFHGAVKM